MLVVLEGAAHLGRGISTGAAPAIPAAGSRFICWIMEAKVLQRDEFQAKSAGSCIGALIPLQSARVGWGRELRGGRTGPEGAVPPLGVQALLIMSQQSSSLSKEGKKKKSLKKVKINQPQIINKRDES